MAYTESKRHFAILNTDSILEPGVFSAEESNSVLSIYSMHSLKATTFGKG
jgi:hypothetical protein